MEVSAKDDIDKGFVQILQVVEARKTALYSQLSGTMTPLC